MNMQKFQCNAATQLEACLELQNTNMGDKRACFALRIVSIGGMEAMLSAISKSM